MRVARATTHLRATLLAGFTTIRDLGTEGAQYADVELKHAVEQGIIPGPRMLVVTRAIVATGSYAPKGFALEWRVPPGRRGGGRRRRSLARVVRDQIGHGADWIKLYADYRWGPSAGRTSDVHGGGVDARRRRARTAGVPVAVHATTPEGMRRAILAGAGTIEHGDDGTPEVFKLMAERNVVLCADLDRRRSHGPVCGLEEGAGRGAGVDGAEARKLQSRARRGRDHSERQRQWRVRAR